MTVGEGASTVLGEVTNTRMFHSHPSIAVPRLTTLGSGLSLAARLSRSNGFSTCSLSVLQARCDAQNVGPQAFLG